MMKAFMVKQQRFYARPLPLSFSNFSSQPFSTSPSPSPSPSPPPPPPSSYAAILKVGVPLIGVSLIGVSVFTFFVYQALPSLKAIPEAVDILKGADVPTIANDIKKANIPYVMEEMRRADIPGALKVIRDVAKKGVSFKLFGISVGNATIKEEKEK